MRKDPILKNSLQHILRFEKASPEALDLILNALNDEVEEAKIQKRFPKLEGAFQRFCPNGLTKILM